MNFDKLKRVFVAIDLPDSIKQEIAAIQDSLPNFYGRKTSLDNLHLTLKFIGEVDYGVLEKVKSFLNEVKSKKFHASLGEVGFFDNRKYKYERKIILWISLDNCNILQGDVDSALSGILEKEKRFMSHITIARIKSVKNEISFYEDLKKIKMKKSNFLVENFKLKESVLKESGPEYRDLVVYPLIS